MEKVTSEVFRKKRQGRDVKDIVYTVKVSYVEVQIAMQIAPQSVYPSCCGTPGCN